VSYKCLCDGYDFKKEIHTLLSDSIYGLHTAGCNTLKGINLVDAQTFKTPTLIHLKHIHMFQFNKLSYLCKLFNVHRPIRLRLSHQANRFSLNRSRTSFVCRAFCHAAPTFWNCLLAELTYTMSSLASFKRCLKTFVPSIIQFLIPAGPPRLRFIITMIDLWRVASCVLFTIIIIIIIINYTNLPWGIANRSSLNTT